MPEFTPPSSDGIIERHQFYSRVIILLRNSMRDINGLGVRLATESTAFELVRDEVKSASIRNRTLVLVDVVIWTVISGGVGLYIQRGVANFDNLGKTQDEIEKRLTTAEYFIEQNKDVKTNIDAIKSRLKTMEEDVYKHSETETALLNGIKALKDKK